MVVFPNAKINLGLTITEKRLDGYHNIESCFYPIPLVDALEVVESKKLSFTSSGISIPGNTDDNLCLKAYYLLKEKHNLPPVAIHLHKNIPIGAGLGGGSSDGAFMIKLLNDKFNLGESADQMENMALKLGSDCPFFIRNEPLFVEGTGNLFSKINLELKGYFLALALPQIHVSTAQAYAGITPKKPIINLKEVLENPDLGLWDSHIKNDFEYSVFKLHPSLAIIKNSLKKAGALYTSMTGSGSAVFGLFKTEPNIELAEPVKILRLT